MKCKSGIFGSAYVDLPAWNIKGAALASQSDFSLIANRDTIAFGNSGSRLWAQRRQIGNDVIEQYDLSEAFNPGTRSATGSSLTVDNGFSDANVYGISAKPDGTKLFVLQSAFGGRGVYEYDLSAAWSVGGASFVHSFSFGLLPMKGLAFSLDGKKMFLAQSSGSYINEYVLATEWDVSSAILNYQLQLPPLNNILAGLFFRPSGRRLFAVETTGRIFQYSLSAEWDLSSGYLYAEKTMPTSDLMAGLAFSDDGLKFFCGNDTDKTIDTYSLN